MNCYIGREKCGCVTVAIVDNPEHKKATAKEVAKCIREGMTVELMPVEAVRELPFGCKCKDKTDV